ncbi:hypothetical protein [Atlantibacter subterraneus]|jgi:hypothetical protein|nr:hypothetical protein [Atlantibacter subterranea]MDA3133515.1 hypothetical protein [Atlantibacter subterranea]MDW2743291.1 hypothetical protein [Atlantibacter subterranea]
MMIEHYLQNLKQVWASEPRRHSPSPFYLSPEQRIRILRELLCPVSKAK